MPVWRMQCCWQVGSALPRDRVCINPVFNDQAGTSVQDLVDDLADALKAWQNAASTTRELVVKAYDAEGTKPIYPAATAKRDVGSNTELNFMREIALCLSFYSEHNAPRRRGRVYVPIGLVSSGGGSMVRPSTVERDKVAALAPIFQNLGGLNTDWSVFSVRDHTARAVTNWFVDDEWDIQRRRGLRATARNSGTTAEMS